MYLIFLYSLIFELMLNCQIHSTGHNRRVTPFFPFLPEKICTLANQLKRSSYVLKIWAITWSMGLL